MNQQQNPYAYYVQHKGSAPMRDFYKVLIVGASGKGKTMSFRNMNPETTAFINVENKPLPFPNRFRLHKTLPAYTDLYSSVEKAAAMPQVEAIVIDSFSAWLDMLVYVCRSTKKGFDVWNFHNEEIGRFLKLLKEVQKDLYITAHWELLSVESGHEKRVKVKGKEWEGLIEKEFTVVLFAEAKKEPNKRPEYWFNLMAPDCSAKCPPGIFGDDVFKVANDLALVDAAIKTFAVKAALTREAKAA